MASVGNVRRPLVRGTLGATVFVLVVAAVAAAGSVAAGSSSSEYAALVQPSWAPPSWVFGPVWTVLYLMIAASGWRLWWVAGTMKAARPEFLIYAAGLVLNGAWTPLFFAADARVIALADIVLLNLVIIVTIVLFARLDRIAASLLYPYLGWSLFAMALNSSIVVLN